MPAGGEKECDAARHVLVDLCIQRLEVNLEQRPEQHGYGDKIKEEPGCRCQLLRGKGWQGAKLVRLHHLGQQTDPKLGAEITRRPADCARQIREAAALLL